MTFTTVTTNMNLFETLKQLKAIKADTSYSEKSRRIVLANPQHEYLGARQIFVRILEAAGSLALAGVLVLAIAGGFSGFRYFSPISFQGIDPAALHAEAQAIDMQINIANLDYVENSNGAETTALIVPPSNAESSTPTAVDSLGAGPIAITSTSSGALSGGATSTSSTTFSINEALQKLEQ